MLIIVKKKHCNVHKQVFIVTDSYQQIIHEQKFNATVGKITCSEFVDANGKTYTDWIPLIILEWKTYTNSIRGG
jgi:hypothetical protein